jgi:ketosteroid isomerase-like protein
MHRMETEETRDVIHRFVEARASNDAATIDALLTDDAIWTAPNSAKIGPFEGRETVVRALTGGAAGKLMDLDTVKRDVRSIIVDGDRAVVQQRLTATARNGNDYANEYCWVYTCRDGRVCLLEEYADTLHAGRVFGWIKD